MADRGRTSAPSAPRAGWPGTHVRLGALAAALTAVWAGAPSPTGGMGSWSRSPAAEVRYVLLPESRLEVQTSAAGLFRAMGDSHRVRARDFTGTVVHDPDDPAASSVEVTIQVEGLEVLTSVSESARAEIRRSMLGQVLRADEFPEIRFVSRRVEPVETAVVRVTGDLTLTGHSREVTTDVELEPWGSGLRARTELRFRQTDFGIEPYRAALGTIRVADEVTLRVEALAVRASAPTPGTAPSEAPGQVARAPGS